LTTYSFWGSRILHFSGKINICRPVNLLPAGDVDAYSYYSGAAFFGGGGGPGVRGARRRAGRGGGGGGG